MSKSPEFDTSGFQAIVLMLIGVLMIILISNVLTIISNPDNIRIGSIVTGRIFEDESEDKTFIPPKFQNLQQKPVYVDVEANRLTIYPEMTVVEGRDLLLEGNEFERFLDRIESQKAELYIILLLRPGSANFQRRLRQIIRSRDVGVGFEPWEANRPIVMPQEEG